MSKLAREILQSRPFQSPRHEATLALFKTTDVVRRRVSTGVEQFGITLQQYNVLRILRGAEPSGLPSQEIGRRMIEHSPGVTRMIDRLEAKGFVFRERDGSDRRVVKCRISASGLELLASMDTVVNELDESSLGDLSDKEVRQLIRLLDRVRELPNASDGVKDG